VTVPALELRDVYKSFGRTEIIRGATLAVQPGERIAIIGPNGAGKSTLFNLISGRFGATSGQILLEGHVGRGVHLEALVASRDLSLGARECVLFVGPRVQENGKVLSHRLVAERNHLLGRAADDHVVPVGDRQAEELVPHRAADHVRFHAYCSNCASDSVSRSASRIHSCIAGNASTASA